MEAPRDTLNRKKGFEEGIAVGATRLSTCEYKPPPRRRNKIISLLISIN